MEQRVFISYAGADRAWAEWVAWQLTDAGCSTFFDVRDVAVGENFLARIERELDTADAMVVLLSAGWATSSFAAAEIRSGIPLVPVRLDGTPIPAEVRAFQAVDLVGADEAEARDRLVQAVLGIRSAPSDSPTGHLVGERRLRRLGLAGPRTPGSLPRVWNLPARNPGFVGRDEDLSRLRDELTDRSEVVVMGPAGSGKTQLALEYAYRFAGEYELVWWIRSNRPIEKQLAELAARIGAAPVGTPPAEATEALKAELRERSRWLLVFDDVTDPTELTPHMPDGVGHVLITAPPALQHSAHSTEFNLDFTRAESIALLRSTLPSVTVADADAVAAALDDLPLALAHALAVLRDGLPVREFLRMLTVDDGAEHHFFPPSLVATVHMAVDRLRAAGPPGVARLLFACALLAPAPLPVGTKPSSARGLPDPLIGALPDGQALPELLQALRRYGLVHVQDETVRLHPLTQSVLRDLLPDSERTAAARTAEALLLSAVPDDDNEPGAEQRWTDLLPHLLAVDPAVPVTAQGRHTVRAAGELLMERGDASAARDRLTRLFRSWSSALGDQHPDTLLAAVLLAKALRRTGAADASRQLLADILDRRRRTLGEDHPDTLVTAARLAAQLGEDGEPLEASRLAEETLGRMRRVLGEDHPVTLTLAANLAVDLRDLGDTDGALRLVEEVLVRRRRVLGQDHPDSLAAAADLAALRAGHGATEAARDLAEEVYVRRRRVLGELHPDTVATARLLIRLLTDLGKQDSAQELDEYMSARSTDALQESGVPAPSSRAKAGAPLAWWSRIGSVLPPTDDGDHTGELALGSWLRRRDVVSPRDAGSDATWHESARGSSATALHPRSVGGPSDVLLSYAEHDENWAEWAASHLEEAGHTVGLHAVDARGEGTELPALLSRHTGAVLALISTAYLSATGLADESEISRLRLLDALARRQLVPIVIERPEPRLPAQLAQHAAGPPLAELDEEAARELLDYAVRSPHRPVVEREFPGTSSEPSWSLVLERQLVNALLNSAFIASPGERDRWLELIDAAARQPISRSVPRAVGARTDIACIVRTCLRYPDGLTAMAQALELLDDPDSAEVREVRRIVDRIELLRDAV
ncbi:FxSxx-COOH system tetratricopeptide repeat protein [Streptomyces sp. WM6386]|uniref:FxSxx-COOH system tetratricopeptide repeat protein n=1 Tax=Streptomyces sp. WM6386 TaxID=1415558 RepID=UPI0006973B82|nr:FxSxx-COOH system tetratricopeptide repeat protein [Streptomyces sp. WM6386]